MSQLRIQSGLKHCWNEWAAICSHLKRSHWDHHRGATAQRSENTKTPSPPKKKNNNKNTTELSQLQHFVAQSTLVIYCEHGMEHLGRNRGSKIWRWTSWQRGSGGGCCWQACWKSDDKCSQSDSYFGFCQFGGAEQTLSSMDHCVLMRTCLLDPSLHRSCDHSLLLLRDVSQRLRQNNPIRISTQFFFCFPGLMAKSVSWLVHGSCKPSVTTLVCIDYQDWTL